MQRGPAWWGALNGTCSGGTHAGERLASGGLFLVAKADPIGTQERQFINSITLATKCLRN